MSSGNQYTALGPAAAGFQADGANIAKGAEVALDGFSPGVSSEIGNGDVAWPPPGRTRAKSRRYAR